MNEEEKKLGKNVQRTEGEFVNSAASTGCCGPNSAPGCCSNAKGNSGVNEEPSIGKSRWKLALFLVIMALAITLGGYSIVKKSSGTSDESAIAGGLACCPGGAASCAPKLSATAMRLVKDNDAVFIMLPHQYLEPEVPIEPIMQATVGRLNSKGKKADGIIVETLTDDYTALTKEFAVISFPTMLILSQSGNVQFVTGEMTEDRLTRALVAATAPASACCPPSIKTRG